MLAIDEGTHGSRIPSAGTVNPRPCPKGSQGLGNSYFRLLRFIEGDSIQPLAGVTG